LQQVPVGAVVPVAENVTAQSALAVSATGKAVNLLLVSEALPLPSLDVTVSANLGGTNLKVAASATLEKAAPAIPELPGVQISVRADAQAAAAQGHLSLTVGILAGVIENDPGSGLPGASAPGDGGTTPQGAGGSHAAGSLPPAGQPAAPVRPVGADANLLLYFTQAQDTNAIPDNQGPQAQSRGNAPSVPPATAARPASPRLDGSAASTGEDNSDLLDLLFEESAAPPSTAAVADRVFAEQPQDDSAAEALPANAEDVSSELLVAFTLAGGVGAEMLFADLLARLRRAGRLPKDQASRELILWLMGGTLAVAGSLHSCRRRKGSEEKRRPGANPSSWKWLAGSATLSPGVGS